jgi:hypothetical protein
MNSSDDFVSVIQTVFEAVTASTTFSLLLGFLGLYCLVLFADIVLLFILRPVGGDLKKGFFGTKERPLASARSLNREWKNIEARLGCPTPSEYKLAILEADAFLDRVLSEMGYAGSDAGGRIEAIPPGHFSKLDALREAHEARNRVVLERNFVLGKTEAARVLGLYREFLEEAEILS